MGRLYRTYLPVETHRRCVSTDTLHGTSLQELFTPTHHLPFTLITFVPLLCYIILNSRIVRP
jgi:hypothetical protein